MNRTCQTCALWQGNEDSYLGICGLPTSASSRTEFNSPCGAHLFKETIVDTSFTIELNTQEPDAFGTVIQWNSGWEPFSSSDLESIASLHICGALSIPKPFMQAVDIGYIEG